MVKEDEIDDEEENMMARFGSDIELEHMSETEFRQTFIDKMKWDKREITPKQRAYMNDILSAYSDIYHPAKTVKGRFEQRRRSMTERGRLLVISKDSPKTKYKKEV